VDVGNKEPSKRSATASGRIYIPFAAYELIAWETKSSDSCAPPLSRAQAKARSKGDVLTVAQLAGIMGCKRTSDLIPLCHPLLLTHVDVSLTPEELHPLGGDAQYSILCQATVSCHGKTGVEMEALAAVSVALLTVWDMLKAVAGREMVIGDIKVSKKSGGTTGDFERER